jgi:hypothetical protein
MFAYMYVQLIAALDVSPLPKPNADNLLATVLQVFFGILAALSLLTITYGGFRYVISRGNPQDINKSKDIIMYAILGLLIALAAQSIINFVLNKVG